MSDVTTEAQSPENEATLRWPASDDEIHALLLEVERLRATTDGVYRHDDDSECLWSTTDQGWYQMHPLYPLRRCGRHEDS